MKTPDEIKKGLECCNDDHCLRCPYKEERMCRNNMEIDALAYIQQLERERDAAVADVRNSLNCCKFCKHDDGMDCKSDPKPIDRSCFEWRGVKED